MTEYPQDIIKAADDVCRAMDIASTPTNCLPIMDALTAERERCAKLCEEVAMQSGGALTEKRYSIYTVGSADMLANNVHPGTGYAALIREGLTSPKPSSETSA